MTMDIGLDRCFGCGKDNPVGLHLHKTTIGDRANIEFLVRPEFTGFPGLLHGGVTCILFDEVMFHAVAIRNITAVLAKISVDYKSPAYTGDRISCEAWITRQDGRKIEVSAVIKNNELQTIVAEAQGLFIEVDIGKLLDNKGITKA